MSVSYKKLWKLLVDKEMTKTELRTATGITTTALAKLGRDESVNLDILVKICQYLECDIGDIMEITENTKPSFYKAFTQKAVLVDENELLRIYQLQYEGESYAVKVTKKTADKNTVIYCQNDTVVWEQLDPTKISAKGDKTVLTKRSLFKKESNTLLVVSGKPADIINENGATAKKTAKGMGLTVLPQHEFKKYEPSKE